MAATEGPLIDHAIQAEKHLEQLATGLADAGAAEETVKAVGQMADVVRKIVSALGQGQETTGDAEGPEGSQPPAEESPQGEAAHGASQPRSFDEASRQMMAERKQ